MPLRIDAMPPMRAHDEVIDLDVHVQPNARRTEPAGLHGDRLKIRVAAPPVDGRANRELCRGLAKWLGIGKACVIVVAGAGARRKRLRIRPPKAKMSSVAKRLRAACEES